MDTYGAEREPVGHKLLEGTDRLFGFAAAKGPLARFARQYLVAARGTAKTPRR